MTRGLGVAAAVSWLALVEATALARLGDGGSSCRARPPETATAEATAAKGDGHTDDTAALQEAIDGLRPGGTLRLRRGTYRIATDRGLRLKDDMRLDLTEATLTGDNVDGARCRLIEIQGKRNVTISGGVLVGSRSGNPQWGVGILASDAEDLVIENVTLRDFFFDGILLTGNAGCRRVTVKNCLSENNRRTGLAVPSARDVTVTGSTFRGSRGQSPEAGVNCEPGPGAEVHNVRFSGCTFSGNAGIGLYVHRALGVAVSEASVENSEAADNDQGIVMSGVDGVLVTANEVSGHRGKARSGIALGDGTRRATVSGNRLEGNFRGIVAAGATGVEIRGNTIVGTGASASPGGGEDGDGVVCRGLKGLLPDACTIAENTVRDVAGSGILGHLVTGLRVFDNTVEDSGQRGVFFRSTVRSEVRRNRVLGGGREAAGRYDGIELAQSANENVITGNEVHRRDALRNAIGIAPDCRGNQVSDNRVVAAPVATWMAALERRER